VLTTPLLVGLDGEKKMSKSLGNYVGIAEPPAEQFGKLMSIPDAALPMYLRYATAWPPEQIEDTVTQFASGELHPNAAKRLLGRTVADLYHGPGTGEAAEAEFDRVFKRHEPASEMAELDVPAGTRLSDVLKRAELVRGSRDADRTITAGSVRVDGTVWRNDDVLSTGTCVVQVGKRRWVRAVVRP